MGEKSSRAYQVFVNMEYTTTEHVQISKGSFQLNNYIMVALGVEERFVCAKVNEVFDNLIIWSVS